MSETKPIQCRRCSHEVARTDGENIYFGGHKVPLVATSLSFLCPKCKREGKWRRQPKVDKGVVKY